jgi:hypothetical protein
LLGSIGKGRHDILRNVWMELLLNRDRRRAIANDLALSSLTARHSLIH